MNNLLKDYVLYSIISDVDGYYWVLGYISYRKHALIPRPPTHERHTLGLGRYLYDGHIRGDYPFSLVLWSTATSKHRNRNTYKVKYKSRHDVRTCALKKIHRHGFHTAMRRREQPAQYYRFNWTHYRWVTPQNQPAKNCHDRRKSCAKSWRASILCTNANEEK